MKVNSFADTWIYVGPLDMVVLLHHLIHSPDAANDADFTVGEIVNSFDNHFMGKLPKQMIESALYCCNMEYEQGRWWHPLGKSFHPFVDDLLTPRGYEFDFYYNTINDRKPNRKK